jgi:hypothetical protein
MVEEVGFMMTSRMKKIVAVSIAAAFALALGVSSVPASAQTAPAPEQSAPASAQAGPQGAQVQQPAEGGVNWPGVGYGAAALFGNLLYLPAKLTYALLGSIVGGGAWCLTGGNTQTANTIWRSSLGGDYVLTPQMVAGEQPINFSGPTETSPEAAASPETTQPQPAPPMSSSGGMGSSQAPAGGAMTAPPPPQSGAASAGSSSAGAQPMDAGSGPVPQAGSEPAPPPPASEAAPPAPPAGSGPATPPSATTQPLPPTSIE